MGCPSGEGVGGGASALEPADWPRGGVAPDVFGLPVLGQPRRSELAPVAGPSEPAPLGLRQVGAEVVDPDRAVPEGPGDPLGPAGVGGPDRTGESVVGVVA